jgi:hypothetical protein
MWKSAWRTEGRGPKIGEHERLLWHADPGWAGEGVVVVVVVSEIARIRVRQLMEAP